MTKPSNVEGLTHQHRLLNCTNRTFDFDRNVLCPTSVNVQSRGTNVCLPPERFFFFAKRRLLAMSRNFFNWISRASRRAALCSLINHLRRSKTFVATLAVGAGVHFSSQVSSSSPTNFQFYRMDPEIAGKYKLVSSENFDEYMKALGVNMVTRKMANAASPVTEITVNGDEYYIKTSTTFKTTEIKFKLDEEFEETTADGRVVRTTIVKDGNKLIQDQKGDKPTTIVREFDGDTMTMVYTTPQVLTFADKVCTRVYKRQ